MKLSILIPTHNRPELFKRSINSILNNLPDYPIEIIVNNDSKDITEIHSDQVQIRYNYQTSIDISDIYQLLYDQSRGEYVYILEDDDYIRSNFFDNIIYDSDVLFIEYISEPEIEYYGPVCAYKMMRKNRKYQSLTNLSEFFNVFDDEYFQLSQIIFKNNLIDQVPRGNNIRNDYHLLGMLAEIGCSFKYIAEQKWVQTTDGMDNISVPELNNDTRFYEE